MFAFIARGSKRSVSIFPTALSGGNYRLISSTSVGLAPRRFSKNKNSKKKHVAVSSESRIAKKKQEYQDILDGKVDVLPVAKTPKIVPLPLPLPEHQLTSDESSREKVEAVRELNLWLESLDDRAKNVIQQDFQCIAEGKPTRTDICKVLDSILTEITHTTDIMVLRHVISIGRHLDFHEMFINEFAKLTSCTSEIVVDKLKSWTRLDDFANTSELRCEAVLAALPPFRQRQFHERVRNAHVNKQVQKNAEGSGRSMLPTLPEEPTSKPCIPIGYREGEMTPESLQTGHIVTFVVKYKSERGKSLGKRVVGLPGDVVVDSHGRSMIVPDKHFWAVGDNLAESYDSRHFGAVPLVNLRSRILVDDAPSII